MLEKLRALRRWGASLAIPLQVLALVITFLQVVVGLPLDYFMLSLLDELRGHAYGVGISTIWWVIFWFKIVANIVLWLLLTVVDADQDGLEIRK